MPRQFKNISLGGTFDFLHLGHRNFLKHALDISEFVSVGIVSDEFAKVLGKDPFQSYTQRRIEVDEFLSSLAKKNRYKLLKLDNIYGNTLEDSGTEGLLVTKDTFHTANKVNKRRKSLKLEPLELISFADVKSGDVVISSSHIKSGVLNDKGLNFENLLKSHDFLLPESLRTTLIRPFGKVVKKIPRNLPFLTITVGDQTTFDFFSAGLRPFVSIIDFKIQRTKVFSKIENFNFGDNYKIINAHNPSGHISQSLSKSVLNAYRNGKSSVIVVDGEEDLATIPAVLLAPIPSTVYYGLRKVGLVKINVDLDVKNRFLEILNKFTQS